jgi:hypothetical protein
MAARQDIGGPESTDKAEILTHEASLLNDHPHRYNP